jgi:hypothetical protein
MTYDGDLLSGKGVDESLEDEGRGTEALSYDFCFNFGVWWREGRGMTDEPSIL